MSNSVSQSLCGNTFPNYNVFNVNQQNRKYFHQRVKN